jgi:hypothetical protein
MGQLRNGNPAKVSAADLEKCYELDNEVRVDSGDSNISAVTEQLVRSKTDSIYGPAV